MDRLSYAYYNGGNFLVKVSDAANKIYGFKDGSNTDNDYGRDANGNTTRDRNKGITEIAYNYLNLPTQVSFGTNKIDYIYDASGTKLKKAVTQGSSVTNTEYAGNYIYENGSLAFFSHPEGYVTKENNVFKYVYQYKDHLGNVRLSYTNTGTTNVPELVIIEENNYYPFGLEHKGYNNQINGVENKYYTYNGKEWNENLGLSMYEMDLRQFDPAIARWVVQDPVVHHSTSPYTGFENNPVFWADPFGTSVIRINGGVMFTGTDAVEAFRQLQQVMTRGQNRRERKDSGKNKDNDTQQNPPRPSKINLALKDTDEIINRIVQWGIYIRDKENEERIFFSDIIEFHNRGKSAWDKFWEAIGGDSENTRDIVIKDDKGNSVRIGYLPAYYKHYREHGNTEVTEVVSVWFYGRLGNSDRYDIKFVSHARDNGNPPSILYMNFYGKDFYEKIKQRIENRYSIEEGPEGNKTIEFDKSFWNNKN